MALTILIIYGLALSIILVYGFMQFRLIRQAVKYKKINHQDIAPLDTSNPENIPHVTVQLPVYNEYYVVERLIDAVAGFQYPADKLEIQVLDDSTDETYTVIQQKTKELQEKGICIYHIHRKNRVGYKAGALAHGTRQAKGEFIAIFDADFIPNPDFLQKTLPYFKDHNTGMVQTRWGHVNEDYSLLTRMQAFGLNAHFHVEQAGRHQGGHFLNFNGTGGVWRKSCIVDAGGWHHNTLAEDLDLSYRAQLRGWKFIYLDHVVAPAELPVVMSALKSQQFRWTKGGAENLRKLYPNILSAKKIKTKTKLFALSHLMNSSLFIFILITGLLSIPVLFIKSNYPEYNILFYIGSVFLVAMLIFFLFYWTAFQFTSRHKLFKPFVFIYRFILFLSFSMGLSLHNSIAALEGYTGKRSAFVRTPKFNIQQSGNGKSITKYLEQKISCITWLEGLLSLYFMSGIFYGVVLGDYGLAPFHAMFAFGFGITFYYSLRQIWFKPV